jgi:hypothetical protein
LEATFDRAVASPEQASPEKKKKIEIKKTMCIETVLQLNKKLTCSIIAIELV